MADQDDEVGYGRPPKQHQFQKGRSGNPRGRKPKEVRSLTTRQMRRDFLGALESEVTVTIDGAPQALTYQQLIMRNIVARAAKGERLFIKMALELYGQFMPAHERDVGDGMRSLENAEKYLIESDGKGWDNNALKMLNELRRKTRKH